MNRINKLIKQKMQEHGLRQKDVAKALGYTSPQFVSNWHRCVSRPPLKAAPKLCEILCINENTYKKILVSDFKEELDAVFR